MLTLVIVLLVRHVKCDESIPSCRKCVRANRTCRYQDGITDAPTTKYVVYTLPENLGLCAAIPPRERRALWHFQHRTAQQIEGSFGYGFWSTIVPRLVQDDAIIRQAVLALSAFHEHYLDHDVACPCLSDNALRWYQKARQQVIDLDSPDNFFDSILCACIIFCTCDALLGNFELANQHAVSGMKMIAGWRASTATSSYASVFQSAEKNLGNLFRTLQAQIIEANLDAIEVECPEVVEQMEDIPDHFDGAAEAFPHLQTLSTQVFSLFQDAEAYYKHNTWVPSRVSPPLQPSYNAICAKYDAWKMAMSNCIDPAKGTDRGSQAAYLLLDILASSLEINLHVFVHGEPAYDDFRETNHAILNLVEEFLTIQSSIDTGLKPPTTHDQHKQSSFGANHSSFTSSPEVVPLLFEIATRTNDGGLRQRALQVLRSSSRRESTWDCRVAASLAEKIVRLKQQGAEQAGKYGTDCKFLITDIMLLSEQKCMVQYGFKRVRSGSFNSFWLENICPGQGSLSSQILSIT